MCAGPARRPETVGLADERVGRGSGLAVYPGEPGIPQGVAASGQGARPPGASTLPGAAADSGGSCCPGMGPAGLGGPLCGRRSDRTLLGPGRNVRRHGGTGSAAARRARGGEQCIALGAPTRRWRPVAQDRTKRCGGPDPHSRRRSISGGRRVAAGAGGGADRGCLVRRPGPSAGAGSGDGDHELLLALEGEAEGRTHRQIAAEIWGRDRVDAEYYTDGWMHSRIKRRLKKAKAIVKQFRDMAAGR